MGAPEKCAFLKDGMNIVDVLAILPYFVTALIMESNIIPVGSLNIFILYVCMFYFVQCIVYFPIHTYKAVKPASIVQQE